MVYLPDLQREQEARRERMRRAYEKVCLVRRNESEDDKWRREQAGLEWIADFLLEGNLYLRKCIFDGARLKQPSQTGTINSINGGYNFGFDIDDAAKFGQVLFPLYVMDIHQKGNKRIFQCLKCRVVYSLPYEVDVDKLRKMKKPEPIVFR